MRTSVIPAGATRPTSVPSAAATGYVTNEATSAAIEPATNLRHERAHLPSSCGQMTRNRDIYLTQAHASGSLSLLAPDACRKYASLAAQAVSSIASFASVALPDFLVGPIAIQAVPGPNMVGTHPFLPCRNASAHPNAGPESQRGIRVSRTNEVARATQEPSLFIAHDLLRLLASWSWTGILHFTRTSKTQPSSLF